MRGVRVVGVPGVAELKQEHHVYYSLFTAEARPSFGRARINSHHLFWWLVFSSSRVWMDIPQVCYVFRERDAGRIYFGLCAWIWMSAG